MGQHGVARFYGVQLMKRQAFDTIFNDRVAFGL